MNINPFVLSPAIPDEFFCDRQNESAFLTKSMKNQENVVLISPRRVGKTGLVYHCFNQPEIKDNYITISIDILHTTSFQEFIKELGAAVFHSVAKQSERLTKLFVATLRSLSGSFGLDPMTLLPTFDVKLGQISTPEYTLEEIFSYLEKADRPCIIAIDEFQQITKYPETGIEALLRSHIQFIPNAHFVFSGSKRRLMTQIFNSPERPFYQSTVSIGLEPLHEEIYYDFTRRFFEAKTGSFSQEMFHHVYHRFDGVTRSIQLMLNRLYETEKNVCSEAQINEAILHIVNQSSMQYEELINLLTANQLSLMKAIAQEGCVVSPQGDEFIKRYNLPSASSIKTALDVLLDKDLVYRTQTGYIIYDHFLAIWLRRL